MDDVKRTWWLTYRLNERLRELFLARRSSEAVAYLGRILDHRRLARVFLNSPAANSIPALLVFDSGNVPRAEVRRLLRRIRPHLDGEGVFVLNHVEAWMDRPLWRKWGPFRDPPDPEIQRRYEEAARELFEMFGHRLERPEAR